MVFVRRCHEARAQLRAACAMGHMTVSCFSFSKCNAYTSSLFIRTCGLTQIVVSGDGGVATWEAKRGLTLANTSLQM